MTPPEPVLLGTPVPGTPGVSAEAAGETPVPAERIAYRLLSGPDDRRFCERVSAALADGYVLYGSPAATFNGERVVVAQAVVLPGTLHAGGPAVGATAARGADR